MCTWFHGFLNPFKILPVPQLPNHFLGPPPPPPNPVNTDRQNQLVNIPWQSKFIPQLSTFNHGTFSSPDIKLVRLIIVNPISKHNLDCNLINFTAFNKTYLTHIQVSIVQTFAGIPLHTYAVLQTSNISVTEIWRHPQKLYSVCIWVTGFDSQILPNTSFYVRATVNYARRQKLMRNRKGGWGRKRGLF